MSFTLLQATSKSESSCDEVDKSSKSYTLIIQFQHFSDRINSSLIFATFLRGWLDFLFPIFSVALPWNGFFFQMKTCKKVVIFHLRIYFRPDLLNQAKKKKKKKQRLSFFVRQTRIFFLPFNIFMSLQPAKRQPQTLITDFLFTDDQLMSLFFFSFIGLVC